MKILIVLLAVVCLVAAQDIEVDTTQYTAEEFIVDTTHYDFSPEVFVPYDDTAYVIKDYDNIYSVVTIITIIHEWKKYNEACKSDSVSTEPTIKGFMKHLKRVLK